MVQLTPEQRAALQQRLNNDDVSGFYGDLESYGDPYGRLGKGVTDNDTWQGQLANGYAESAAEDNGKDMSYGSPDWEDLNRDLAERYLQAINDSQGNTPNQQAIKDMHNEAYRDKNLDPDDWFPNKMLEESDEPEGLWTDWMDNENPSDILEDANEILGAGGRLLFGPQLLAEAMGEGGIDPSDLEFAKNLLDALGNLGEDQARDLLRDLFGDELGNKLADLPGLGDDLGWAWDNPGPVLGEILPPWARDLLGPIFGVPGYDYTPGARLGGGLDPLVFDLDGSGTIDLVSVANSTVYYDFWNDGFAEKTGWVSANDGMLVVDLDENGKINGAAELFGSNFPLSYILSENFTAFKNEENGFARLKQYDANEDGVINAQDAIWAELKIWQDINQDGISQTEELLTLDNIGIASIDVANFDLDSYYGIGGFTRQIAGHTVTHSGYYTMVGGATHEIADVWFENDLQDSYLARDFTLDVRTLFLPNMRGYGAMPDLFVAMSEDNGEGGLLDDVAAFATSRTFTQFFSEFEDVRSEIGSILLKWAGVDLASTAYDVHGVFASLPEYGFLRALSGYDADYLGSWFDGSPFLPRTGNGVAAIYQSWNLALDGYAARLIFQSGGAELFEGDVNYNSRSDVFTGELRLSQAAIEALEVEASSHSDVMGFWHHLAVFIENTMGVDELTSAEMSWLSDAVLTSSVGNLSWADVLDTLEVNVITGTSGDDVLAGTEYVDQINGLSGGDTLSGHGGNDVLNGSSNNDTLIGGEGNDILNGSSGNDTYVYHSGVDVIVEAGGNYVGDTDIIVMGAGITPEDVTLELARLDATATEHVFLNVEGRGKIIIQNDTAYWTTLADLIDEIHFEDGTVLLFPEMDIRIHGTNGDDDIFTSQGFTGYKEVFGYDGNDRLYGSDASQIIFDGGAGDDTLNANGYDEVFIMSAGVDTVVDSGGFDIIRVPEGFDLNDVEFLRIEIGGTYGTYDDAAIVVQGLGTIQIKNFFTNAPSTGKYIEQLQFHDGSVVDLLQQVYTVMGTSGDDRISSPSVWPMKDDIYFFSGGNDLIGDKTGTNILQFGEEYTLDNIYLEKQDIGSHFTNINRLIVHDDEGNSVKFEQHFDGGSKLDYIRLASGLMLAVSSFEIDSHGTESDDSLYGIETGDLTTADTMYGYGGNDSLRGLSGDDILNGGTGADGIYGGAGFDIASYEGSSAGVTINLTQYYQTGGDAQSDYLDSIEGVIGSSFADVITGSSVDNVLKGEGGNDTLSGSTGNDQLYGGEGNDTLNGGTGNDAYYFTSGDDVISETGGTDTIYLPDGVMLEDVSFLRYVNIPGVNAGATDLVVRINDHDGNPDTILGTMTIRNQFLPPADNQVEFLHFHNPALDVDLTNRWVTTFGSGGDDMILGIDYGANPDDVILGFDPVKDVIDGGAGNDSIYGGLGDDELQGGVGNDGLMGQDGNDELHGGEGNDFLFGDQDETVASANFIGNDMLYGDAGEDWLLGDAGDDILYGGADNDVLLGGSGNDTLHGDAGNDYMVGGEGNDILYGGAGVDTFYGEDGADIFAWSSDAFGSVDQVYDFAPSQGDKLNVHEILDGFDDGQDDITAFVQITTSGTNSLLLVDGNGGGDNFVQIATLYGVTGVNVQALYNSGNLSTEALIAA